MYRNRQYQIKFKTSSYDLLIVLISLENFWWEYSFMSSTLFELRIFLFSSIIDRHYLARPSNFGILPDIGNYGLNYTNKICWISRNIGIILGMQVISKRVIYWRLICFVTLLSLLFHDLSLMFFMIELYFHDIEFYVSVWQYL